MTDLITAAGGLAGCAVLLSCLGVAIWLVLRAPAAISAWAMRWLP